MKKLEAQDPHHPSGPGRELDKSEYKVIVKFFTPDSSWSWYAVSASRDEETGNVQFFGLVDGHEVEFGYFWLLDLASIRGPLNLPIERDLHWDDSKTLTEVEREVRERRGGY